MKPVDKRKMESKSETLANSISAVMSANRLSLKKWWNRSADWRDPNQYPTSEADDVIWFTEFARRSTGNRELFLEAIDQIPNELISEYFDQDGRVRVREIAALVSNALGYRLRPRGLEPMIGTTLDGTRYAVRRETPDMTSIDFNLNCEPGQIAAQLRAAKKRLEQLQKNRRERGLIPSIPTTRRQRNLYGVYLRLIDAKESSETQNRIIETLMPDNINSLDTLNKRLKVASEMQEVGFLFLPCLIRK